MTSRPLATTVASGMAGIFSLVVENPGEYAAIRVCRTVVADTQPPGALRLRGVGDLSALVGQAHAALKDELGERVRPAFLVHWQPSRAHQPSRAIDGDSCTLPLALAALGDLHGCEVVGTVACTGAMLGTGAVTSVSWLVDKIEGALQWFDENTTERPKPWSLIVPKTDADTDPSSEQWSALQCEARELDVTLIQVSNLAEAGRAAFGADFAQTPREIGSCRASLHERLYKTDYRLTISSADALRASVASLPSTAPLRGILQLESVAIAHWAAGRLPSQDELSWAGLSYTAKTLGLHPKGARRVAEGRSSARVAPDLQALMHNLQAASDLGPATHPQRGLMRVERGLAVQGLISGHLGEHRRLLGTRSQLRMIAGLRSQALGSDGDATLWLDGAVLDAERALRAAEQPEVAERNDRARVRIYLAQALIGRGAETDDDQAMTLLREVLGLDERLVPTTAPQQAPGWGLRLLYLLLRSQGHGHIRRHWLSFGRALKLPDDKRGLCDDMRFRRDDPEAHPQFYDGSIAALVAHDAAETGDFKLAIEMLGFLNADTCSLRTVARWWPLLGFANLRRLPQLHRLANALDARTIDRPEGPSRDRFVTDLLRRLRRYDGADATAAWRQLTCWLGVPGIRTSSSASTSVLRVDSAGLLASRVRLSRGTTVQFEALPPHSVALDGYVQGPAIDAAARRFSFDHHGNCVRHATLSTCEMALDAVHVGLSPGDLTLYINDLDADTVLSTWLLLQPDAAASDGVVWAVRRAGRRDALGPAARDAGLCPALQWALAPMNSRHPGLRSEALDVWWAVLAQCCRNLDRWWQLGAPAHHAALPAPVSGRTTDGLIRVLHHGDTWSLVQGDGPAALADLYSQGVHAGVVARAKADGSTDYVVGKASEFIVGFDVPAVLMALRDAELRINPTQDSSTSWGGGSTIGGSPRNTDGSGSRLDVADVVRVVDEVCAASAATARV